MKRVIFVVIILLTLLLTGIYLCINYYSNSYSNSLLEKKVLQNLSTEYSSLVSGVKIVNKTYDFDNLFDELILVENTEDIYCCWLDLVSYDEDYKALCNSNGDILIFDYDSFLEDGSYLNNSYSGIFLKNMNDDLLSVGKKNKSFPTMKFSCSVVLEKRNNISSSSNKYMGNFLNSFSERIYYKWYNDKLFLGNFYPVLTICIDANLDIVTESDIANYIFEFVSLYDSGDNRNCRPFAIKVILNGAESDCCEIDYSTGLVKIDETVDIIISWCSNLRGE